MADTVTLARYDAACLALAEAKAIDEVQKIRSTAEALRAYARQAKNKQLEVDAAEIRIRAERRVGELMQAQRDTVGLASGGAREVREGPGGTRSYRCLNCRAVYSEVDGHICPKAPPTLADAGIDKHLADRARKLAAVPADEFEAELRDWRARSQVESVRVTTNLVRAGEREQKRVERTQVAQLAGRYQLIYADPPWQYEHVETENRAVENQYPTMTLDDICVLPVPAADDAVLFLWATSPKLAEALRVVDSWGFSYRTCAIWDKEVIGMGYYFRQQHELLLVAARGALPVPEPSARPSSVLRAKRRQHSQKPDIVYEVLEQMYPAFTDRDRLEMFARETRPGWTAWGNEPAVAS